MLSRLAFLASFAILIGLIGFLFGIRTANERDTLYYLVRDARDDIALVWRMLTKGADADFVQEITGDESNVIVNQTTDDALVLLSGYFEGGNQMRLIERDGTVVLKWPVEYADYFEPGTDDRPDQTDLHGVVIEPDGAVVFNFEYGGMVKLGACGDTRWTLEHLTHHSVEISEKGGYWVPGRRVLHEDVRESFPPFTETDLVTPVSEDLVLRVSEDGEILEQYSLPRILLEGGLMPILTATGQRFHPALEWWDRELLHLNKIEELPAAYANRFPQFEAGDLMMSLRDYNLIVVLDADDRSVKWHQTGPWLRQHDPEFTDDGSVLIFNNNAQFTATRVPNPISAGLRSNIIKMDPVTRNYKIALGARDDHRFFTMARGKHETTASGGYLVTASAQGRLFETDSDGHIIWEYVNRIDGQHVGEINEGRIYTRDYFEPGSLECQ